MQPEVTVVIATRDRPQLIRRAVSSILAQHGVGPLEIIVVFDGTDPEDLSDLLAPHREPDGDGSADSELTVVRNARTPGLAGSRNTGIDLARAPLIAFCDDDDEWKPGKLRAQIPLFKDSKLMLAATGIEICTRDGCPVRVPPTSVDLDDLLRSRITELHPSSFVLRTDALRTQIGLVDEELPAGYGEDYDLLLRAAKLGSIVAVPEPLTVVHWDRTSFFSERWQGIVDGLGYLLDKHPEFARSRTGSARIEGQIAFAHAALGDRANARSWGRRAIRNDIRQPRAYLALGVGLGLLPPERVVAALNRRGRGV